MAVDTIITSDATKSKYLTKYPSSFQKGYSKAIDFCADLDLEAPYLFLNGDGLKRIRKAVGVTFDSPETLAELVEKSCKSKVAGVEVALTPGQKHQLEARARDQKCDPGVVLSELLTAAVGEKLGWY